MYRGVRSPQIGHIARLEQMKIATPVKAITGISEGISFSKSISFRRQQGAINEM
jgi:hypothetical protein